MSLDIERSPERDAALRAALPHVAALGWTRAALAAGLRDLGEPAEAAEWLFPAGPVSALEAWCDLADRDMAAAAPPVPGKVSAAVRNLIALRLQQAAPHKEAVRRGLAVLALPWNARAAARTAARTASAIWYAAGDTSADFSWYTRRATLAALYGSVLAYWMADDSDGASATLDFLDRQMARLGRLQRRRAA
ncbi:COQ9 family protein [Roseomonas sp. BN140053]|uniref:COQ9 family protein n=1 Tax=Roseomonas sp. BN140053 TaxID=3391898 RepID=UPI0039EB5631